MKRTVFFMLFMPLMSMAQGGFEFIYNDSGFWSTFSFMDNQGYYITIGGREDTNTMLSNAFVLKYNDPYTVQVKIFEKEMEDIGFSFGTQLADNNYFFIGTSYKPNPHLYLVQTNQELEITQESYYSLPELYNELRIQDALFNEDGTIILNGTLDDPAPGNENDIYVAKINTQGELIDTAIITDLKNDFGTEIIKKPDGSGYNLVGTYQHNIVSFDNDLNVLEYMDFPVGQDFNKPLAIRRLPNGNLMEANMTSDPSVPGAYYDIRLRIVDEGFNTLKDTTFFDEGKNRLPAFSGMDYVDPDNIWVVSHCYTWKSSKEEWEKARVYLVDSGMNVKGAKYFAGDLDLYLWSVKAMNDGSCIITGIVDGEIANAYIRKMTLDDVITGAEETPAQDDSDVLLFPNPVKDVLHIETYRKDLSINLYDENGRCVVERQQLHVPNTQMDIAHLPGGMYIYSVFDKEKVIETGKIIKQNINQ